MASASMPRTRNAHRIPAPNQGFPCTKALTENGRRQTAAALARPYRIRTRQGARGSSPVSAGLGPYIEPPEHRRLLRVFHLITKKIESETYFSYVSLIQCINFWQN